MIVLIILAAVCAGLIAAVLAKTKSDGERAAAEAAAYTPPAISEPATRSGPRIAVVGDQSVTTTTGGRSANGAWPALLEDAINGEVTATALSGAGYTTEDDAGRSFVDAAGRVPSDSDVVVFVGGAADASGTRLAIASAATRAFSTASQAAPRARLIVIGPIVRGTVSQARMDALRSVLRRSAQVARATYSDPIASGWLGTAASSTADVERLTGSQERTVADRVEGVLRTATEG